MNPKSGQFARDEFGDGYWREFASDAALARTHEHVAVALVPTREDADALADRLVSAGVTAEISGYYGAEQLPWMVTVKSLACPSQQAVAEFRERVRQLASMRGGQLLDSSHSGDTQDAGPLI